MRRAGGALLMSAVGGTMIGAMVWDIGVAGAALAVGVGVVMLGLTELALYLIWEAK